VPESLEPNALREFDKRYLRQVCIQRRTVASCLIDNLPSNWTHIGLRRLMLPSVLMAHCDAVLPGRVRRFIYERMVDDTERAVRQPIFRDAVDHWRHCEPWLDPLKAALGPTLDAYPATLPLQ
jgi:hypothetical protein